MAEMSKVWIEESECISCEACVDACPEVFEMGEDTATIKAEAKDPVFVQKHGDGITEAAEACPVDAVKFE